MRILNVEDGIVPRLLGDLGEVEIERLVVATSQHHEAEGILADLVDDIAHGHESAGAFRHPHRLALVEEIDELTELDVELALPRRQRLHRCLHTLHVADMVGAEHDDHLPETTAELVKVIGDVGGDIGPRAVGLLERSVDVVAEGARAEEGLRSRLPILRSGLALRRLERSDIDEPGLLQRLDSRFDHAGLDDGALGSEDRMADADRREIFADQRHHGRHCKAAHRAEPLALGRREPAVAIARSEGPAGILEIVAGIVAVRDRGKRLAERLAIAQIGRAGEDVDLCAAVVDVVFAAHGVARLFEQRREDVSDHRAARVADMQRPGRVRRDVFDVDFLAASHCRIAIGRTGLQDLGESGMPEIVAESQIDETRPGDVGTGHCRVFAQGIGEKLRELPRVLAGRLGEHHRGVGRDVAVSGIPRRFDRDSFEVETGG